MDGMAHSAKRMGQKELTLFSMPACGRQALCFMQFGAFHYPSFLDQS
jgi:hypothetical protein